MNNSLSAFKISPFFYLNITQFFGNLNDNLYKYLLVYSLIDAQGVHRAPFILSSAGIIFMVPFILLSFYAGILADRFSKRNLILITKAIELATVCILLVSFLLNSPLLRYIGLFILACEEAVIGPAKYSIIPELVEKSQVTKANGYLVSFAYTGIMLGAFLASLLTEFTQRNYPLASSFCILIGAIGLVTAWKIPVTHAYATKKKIRLFFLGDVVRTLKNAASTQFLLPCMFGSAFFLFVAAFSQADIIAYCMHSLGMSDIGGGYFSFITTIGVSIGGVAAGKISGPRAALGLIPPALIGMTVCFFLFEFTVDQPYWAALNALVIGIFAGLYLVPLDAYIQSASDTRVRGQNVAATNFLGWCSVLLAAYLFYILRQTLGVSPKMGFVIMGCLCLVAWILFTKRFFSPMLRLFSSFLASIQYFRIDGFELLPKTGATLIVAKNRRAAFYLLSYRERIVQLASLPQDVFTLFDEGKLCCYVLTDTSEDAPILFEARQRNIPIFTLIATKKHKFRLSTQGG